MTLFLYILSCLASQIDQHTWSLGQIHWTDCLWEKLHRESVACRATEISNIYVGENMSISPTGLSDNLMLPCEYH